MGLADIASGVKVTSKQHDRSVAAIDATDTPLSDRLAPFADDLPCTVDAAVTLVESYINGSSVGESSRAAGLAPVTGAKTLHLLGEPIAPLSPMGRRVVREWIDAECTRAEARELSNASEREFALAVFVETHDPLPGVRETIEPVFMPDSATRSTITKRDVLAETMSDADDLR
ncbi:DUF7858 family protein [Halocatena pleomorpha]|uniref:Uncharacterized protein n=1 Tax=Halocatena pleomorpha TaxID=1785090 RepID=A0A3P3RAF5_9EURY|nr:hypothetical protein [Halocatena pleomorpha]RRJ30467.1 hypothetical protein EIK79_09275 [Halocatena pleomorpha]